MKKKNLIILLIMTILIINPVFADDSCVPGYTVAGCNEYGGIAVKCGIPAGLADMIHDTYDLLKIGVPIVLIIMGMIDMLKAVISQKEDEIKKGWNSLIKRTIYGVSVFFVFFFVQLIVSLLPNSSGKDDILKCTKTIFVGTGDDDVCCILNGANTDDKHSKGDRDPNSQDGKSER